MAALDDERAAEIAIDTGVDSAGVPVVTLCGELDSSNVGLLEAVVDPIVAQRPVRVTFEIGGLRYMDSAGIGVLIRAAADVGGVYLRDPSPIVRRVIEITGLSGVLHTEP
jgi:anti-anti-sigma factor